MTGLLRAILFSLILPSESTSAMDKPEGSGLRAFPREIPAIAHRNPNINYGLDPSRERFYVHVPANYTGSERFGLIVFINSGDQMTALPATWEPVLRGRKLLWIAPQMAGNGQPCSRRYGLAVIGALEMMRQYRVDPVRVYAGGLSGGARIASDLGFYQSDLFHGTIQSVGTNFYRAVPREKAVPLARDQGHGPYGISLVSPEDVARARATVHFVMITGEKDFRHGDILDIYHGGFARDGFKARLLDVPGMGHAICDGAALSLALDFIEAKPSAPDANSRSSDAPG